MTDMLLSRMLMATSPSIEWSVVVKATVLLATALLVVRIIKASRASVRHMVLAATLGVLAILPVGIVAMPPVPVNIPISVIESSAPPPPTVDSSIAATRKSERKVTSTGVHEGAGPLSIATVLRTVWAFGVVVSLLPLVSASMRLRRLRLSGQPWLVIRPLTHRLATQADVTSSVDVLLHENLSVPITMGWLRPIVMLPVDAREWTEAECRNALVHEFEHVRRADWLSQVVGRVVCGLYWFHPLVWVAWREMALDAERACDDAVLQCTDGPSYATQLVNLATRHAGYVASPAPAMATRSDLAARVASILTPAQSRGRAGRGAGATTAVVAILVALTLSPLRAIIPTRPALLAGPFMQTHTPALAGATPAFEVVSIRPNIPDDPSPLAFDPLPGGRVHVNKMSLRELIFRTYQTQSYRIIGGPNWLNTETWEILAKAEGEAPLLQRLGMLRQMLADRFKLVMHTETQEVPIYALVLARKDGTLGPGIKRVDRDCAALASLTKGAPPPMPDGRPPCNHFNLPGGIIVGGAMTMDTLAARLGNLALLGRPVVNQTGLKGTFDYDVKYSADLPDQQGDSVSIFTAFQEQLGLRLQSTRGPVEVYIIDSVERATEN